MTEQPAIEAEPSKWRKRIVRWTIRLLRVLSLVYLGICVLIFFIQNKLIFPGAATQGHETAIVRSSSNFELLELKTASGTPIAAVYGTPIRTDGRPITDAPDAPTIIYFYGNGMSMADCFAEFRRFRQLGCNVIIPEYVGYGMSGGKVSEAMLYETADAAYTAALQWSDPKRIIAIGWSLGGSVAINLASRKPVAGLVTFSTFTSMPNMGVLQFPWLPVRWFIRTNLNSEEAIKKVTCPILLIHGTHDNFVPFAMRDQLAAAAKGAGRDVATLSIDGNHVNIFEQGGDAMDQEISDFIQRCTGK